jgi:hypothetical protein
MLYSNKIMGIEELAGNNEMPEERRQGRIDELVGADMTQLVFALADDRTPEAIHRAIKELLYDPAVDFSGVVADSTRRAAEQLDG